MMNKVNKVNMRNDKVILVDSNDRAIGEMEKMQAHIAGVLHRAFSVFVFHPDGRLLLQRRADIKYHSPGLWTNTCCSHQQPGETTLQAAGRRLNEEMGMKCHIEDVYGFIYKAEVGDGLTEHEFDHILIGITDAKPQINPDEVSEYKYMYIPEIIADLKAMPERYTVWFRIIFENYLNYLNTK